MSGSGRLFRQHRRGDLGRRTVEPPHQAPNSLSCRESRGVCRRLRSSPWQHFDQTARVDGVNQQCHIVCTPLYTVFCTTANKDRLSVLDVLRNLAARTFCFNAETFALLHTLGVAQRVIVQVQALPQEQTLSEAALTALLDQLAPPLGPLQRQHVRKRRRGRLSRPVGIPGDPTAALRRRPAVQLADGRTGLVLGAQGRTTKLAPCVPHHQELLTQFSTQFWDFYDDLLAYRAAPSPAEKVRLTANSSVSSQPSRATSNLMPELP